MFVSCFRSKGSTGQAGCIKENPGKRSNFHYKFICFLSFLVTKKIYHLPLQIVATAVLANARMSL